MSTIPIHLVTLAIVTDLELVNIVGVVDFNRQLNLAATAELLESSSVVREVTYSPEKNHWLQTKFELDGKLKYVAFYKSGSCTSVGCNSFEQLNRLVKVVENSMQPVIRDPPALDITNLMCVGEISRNINLTQLAVAAGLEQVEYEPEQFPGLIYRNNTSGPVLLVFTSGKVVITGVQEKETANQLFHDFRSKLSSWKIIG
jgi:transcription initiation factor TFIID TATA-box-binding protein